MQFDGLTDLDLETNGWNEERQLKGKGRLTRYLDEQTSIRHEHW